VKAWGYGEKSSGGIQTIAALSAFGLLADEGSGDVRKLRLTQAAMVILKDKRAGAAAEALKAAALKPKVIAQLWGEWGATRPPDAESISVLHLDMKFTEEAAGRLLRIYDDTIRYAGLVDADKGTDNGGNGEEDELERPPAANEGQTRLPPNKAEKVPLMANERVVFAHELRPNQSFRVLVTGDIDSEMVDALKAFAEFQSKIIPKVAPVAKAAENDHGQSRPYGRGLSPCSI